MIQKDQTVYFTAGPLIQEATFVEYRDQRCVLKTKLGTITLRRSRVYASREDAEGVRASKHNVILPRDVVLTDQRAY